MEIAWNCEKPFIHRPSTGEVLDAMYVQSYMVLGIDSVAAKAGNRPSTTDTSSQYLLV